MAVRIRLSRVGKKHVPFFCVVAVDSRVKRDGKILADIGTYDVLNGRIVTFHEDRYNEWVAKGALPTDSAKKIHNLFKKTGIYVAPAKAKIERVARSADSDTSVESES
jgi:small subunit ribosomal protein S16